MEADEPLERISPPPSITSALTASGTVGVPFSYSTTATNSPTSFAASNLPAGLSINPATGVISGTPTAAGTSSVGLSATSTFGSGSNTLTLTIAKGPATVSLGDLTQTYDGTVKSASATTSPASLPVDFTYTGASVPPVNAGTYTVFGVVHDANYAGSASAPFTITATSASVSLGNLTQGYDGTAKSVTVTTAPAGLATSVTYDGSAAAPSAVGSYPVSATVTDPNYTGSTTGTLTIRDVTAPVLSLPADLVVEATGPAGAVATFAASASDDVDGSVAVTTSAASGSTFPVGATVVTASATDAAGNVATGHFTVTVRDTTAPSILMSPATPSAIAVTGGSFEDPVTDSYTNTLPGWTGTPGTDAGITALSAMPGRYVGDVGPAGAQVGFINAGSIYQDVGATLVAGRTYTLSGFFGRRSDDPQALGRMALVTASGTVLA
jgi:hypothetical protein